MVSYISKIFKAPNMNFCKYVCKFMSTHNKYMSTTTGTHLMFLVSIPSEHTQHCIKTFIFAINCFDSV